MIDSAFSKHVEEGLSISPKKLSSQYFYDDNGSRIFQQIMAMPEYYLTGCEFEILSTRSQEIFEALAFNGHFNVIELGAGDGVKTKELLSKFAAAGADLTYVPIDISEEAINILVDKMKRHIPGIKINPQVGDYFEVMDKIEAEENCPNLVLFLGANIGNFSDESAVELLLHVNEHIRSGDKLLVGFDLQKNPLLISLAYNDPHGITKGFNLNLLVRINQELGANFQLDQFDFYSHYNPKNGEVRSYLVSLRQQDVRIGAVGMSFHFEKDELIATELSKKYSLDQIEHLALQSGFEFGQHFLDCKHYFSDTLFIKP